MELDTHGAPARGLRRYVRLVAEALDLGATGYCVELEPPVGVYLALDRRLRGFPDRDLALIWDEEQGWAAAMETHSTEDLILLSHLGTDVLPPPRLVARLVEEVLAEQSAVRGDPPCFRIHTHDDDLPTRLAHYAAAGTIPGPSMPVPAAGLALAQAGPAEPLSRHPAGR
jgi:hypothetical protein